VGALLFIIFVVTKKGLVFGKIYLTNICVRRGWRVDVELVFVAILTVLLLACLLCEYIRDPADIQHRLFLIFTLYLALYVVFRIVYHSHVFVFHLSEQDMIPVGDLRNGDIVDKPYLIKIFGSQVAFGTLENPGLPSSDPKKYFEGIENPIDEETVEMLRKTYRTVNEYHATQKTPNFQEITAIKVLKTFPFAPYIFLGFCMTYVWGDGAFRAIIAW